MLRIRIGCHLDFVLPQSTPMIVIPSAHFSRFSDLEQPGRLPTTPAVSMKDCRNSLGNWCSRVIAPARAFTLGTDAIVRDAGAADRIGDNAVQHPVQNLSAKTL